jgi:hypothetical protein
MSCTYDCSGNLTCVGISPDGGMNCAQPPPQAAYTAQQNTTYGFYNAAGQFIFDPALGISSEYTSPATLQSYPLQPGSYASQVIRNNADRCLFASMNTQATQYSTGQKNLLANNQPLFKSHQDLMRYIQGQYTQRLPGTGGPPNSIYTVNSLAPPFPRYT